MAQAILPESARPTRDRAVEEDDVEVVGEEDEDQAVTEEVAVGDTEVEGTEEMEGTVEGTTRSMTGTTEVVGRGVEGVAEEGAEEDAENEDPRTSGAIIVVREDTSPGNAPTKTTTS